MKRWLSALVLLLVPCLASAVYTTPFDTIPDFCTSPTKTAAVSGQWSSGSTWSPSGVPTATDVVLITNSYVVTLDSTTAVAKAVCIVGVNSELVFSIGQNTKLVATTIQVANEGVLQIGSSGTPLPSQYTAEIVIDDVALDTTNDPSMYGNGIVVIDGHLILYGTVKTPYERINAEVAASATSVTLNSSPSGWVSGDQLLIPDSRQLTNSQASSYVNQNETPILSSVSGAVVNFSSGLAYAHPGAKDNLDNSLDFTPHLANLTRNIIVRSENPNGTRGHVYVTRASRMNVQNVRFEGLGRTTTATINDTTYVNGVPNHIGTNQSGRYWFHAHHVQGRSGTVEGYQGVMRGNVFINDGDHTRKWMITLHDTHWFLVQKNVMFNCAGACVMTEEGNETENLVDANFVVRTTGTGDRFGKGSEATGYWSRGPWTKWTNNIAAAIVSTSHGAPNCGHSLWQQQLSTSLKKPNYQGADTATAGQYTLTNPFASAYAQFENNETYSSVCGITYWWVGINLYTPVATADSIIKNYKAWNMFSNALFNYQSHRLVVDGMVTRGTPVDYGCCHSAMIGGDYTASDFTIKNSDVQGWLDGFDITTWVLGTFTMKDSLFVYKRYGALMETLSTSASSASVLPARAVVVDNVKFDMIPGSPSSAWRSIHWSDANGGVKHHVQTDTLTVTNYQQSAGINFGVYSPRQAASFVVPTSTFNGDGSPRVIGCIQAGLTNTQCLALAPPDNAAIAGAITPCTDSTTYPEITGFVCP